jgi:DNA primase
VISRETIDRIVDTARIEEVVGDFVNLKKRGVNLIGLCPFHNEKTPSFNVNPVRNIFKCFGCGKGGSTVNFIMEHEHYSYPDALRYLAGKYNIEITEDKPTPEEAVLRDEKESMMVLNSFAQKTFSENLFDTEEGKSIGLTYFKERGFTEATIRKFQLGYSLNGWDSFSKFALSQTYKPEFLVATGLSIRREPKDETAPSEGEENLFDRFKGRVMFPVHNLSGRVIAFGGRILKKDDKAAKYINSPESEVYHKSQTLYGIYFAKKSIIQNNVCYLVEGYTDVISLHQAGIENAVASSGTSLTSEQIRLISRYTSNITILYDSDAAGIKASLRGMDMILEEGLNVRIVLFPDGDDPDSFARKHSEREIGNFIANNAKDFVLFKTGLLLKDVSNDPIRKAQLIREVVETIARIPDAITRSTYVKHCSSLMEIDEGVLINELNKLRRQHLRKDPGTAPAADLLTELPASPQRVDEFDTEAQEKEILRLLLNFGNEELQLYEEAEPENEDGKKEVVLVRQRVLEYIRNEIERDEIRFSNAIHEKVYNEIMSHAGERGELMPNYFFAHEDPQVSSFAVEMLSPRYFLSENWSNKHSIIVPEEKVFLKDSVERSIFHLKNKKVAHMIEENQKKIKEAHEKGETVDDLIRKQMVLDSIKQDISRILGIDILK